MNARRGPDLPYSMVAGVTPWRHEWIVVSARLAGAVFAPEAPRVFSSFADVLDERPAFASIVVNAPIGYVDRPESGTRTCDREARTMLGRHAQAYRYNPSRSLLRDGATGNDYTNEVFNTLLLPRYREVASQMSPYRQRVVHEGHPELSYLHLNGNLPLVWPDTTEAGVDERRSLLARRINNFDDLMASTGVIPDRITLAAFALVWTARRVFARAADRIPSDPEWDSEGLRMQLVM